MTYMSAMGYSSILLWETKDLCLMHVLESKSNHTSSERLPMHTVLLPSYVHSALNHASSLPIPKMLAFKSLGLLSKSNFLKIFSNSIRIRQLCCLCLGILLSIVIDCLIRRERCRISLALIRPFRFELIASKSTQIVRSALLASSDV